MRYFLLTMWALFTVSAANYPIFEGAGQLKELLIPADVHIGSVIYRLRASDSDHDYPLQFDATDYGSYVVKVENLPCNVNSTHCEANVYLERVLMVGQVFKFRFTVRDTKGDTTTASVSIEVTDAPVDITTIFPHLPGIIILPENTKPGTELEYVIVRRHAEHKKPALLEIRGSSVVDFGRMRSSQETTTGVITLKKGLDFEQQSMYKLQIFALDMYTDKLVDSRNIAGFEIILIVEDVQDTPPIFVNTEPTIKLRSNMTQGDIITKVTAIDGDRGNPRPINYGLVSENNPFTIFFNIDRTTGLITLAKPLKQLTAIARSHQPILITIMAEEERSNIKEPPALSTTATIALLLAEAGNTPPYFDNDHYVCHLNENSPQGAALVFSDAYSTQVHDDDMGKQGVFSLILEKNNGTFEISPNVIERKAYFTIRVRNNLLLDYESRKSVEFVIVARELDPGSLSSSVTVLVYLNDVNDNPPQFQRTMYMSQIPENTTANAYVTEVKASDIDTGLSGRVHYTRILGFRNSSLLLNSVTGVITVASDNHGFDREEASEYHLTVEARDMEGVGLLATVPLIVRILDVNDETPVFENAPFHFTLTPDLRNFSTRAFIKATDKDAEPPNNIVRYEIISGNYNNKFILNSETGELTVRNSDALGIRKRRQTPASLASTNVYTLTVRAYDLGVPHRWSTAQVRIFPPDTGTRLLTFIMPAKGLDYEQMEELLIKITGGQVTIVEIKPYHPHRYSRAVAEPRKPTKEKSSVVARVTYGDNSMIDVEQVYYLLQSIYYKGAPESDQIQYQTAESGISAFWILLLLLLLLIAVCIALLFCYLLKCHPCYTWFSNKKKIQVSDAAQTINLHNKGVQANNHRSETRSSTDSSHRNRWKFHRRREHEPQPIFLLQKNASPMHYRNTGINEDMPAYIYRTDMPNVERHGDLYIQDIADSDYRILDPAKLNVQRLNEQQNTSRTKNYGKNSLERRRRHVSPASREETFVREGQAEILRLQTNDESTAEESQLHQPDKSYYNHFDTNNTSKTSSSHTADTSKKYDANKNTIVSHLDHNTRQEQFIEPPEETPPRQKPKLHKSNHVTESEEAHINEIFNQTRHVLNTESTQRSIPDQHFSDPIIQVVKVDPSQRSMAKQRHSDQSIHAVNIEPFQHSITDHRSDHVIHNINIETQHHPDLAPNVTSEPSQQATSDQTHESTIRFINIEPLQHSMADQLHAEADSSLQESFFKTNTEKLASGVSKIGIINYMHTKPNTDDTHPSTEPETVRNLLDISHLEEERNKLTSFQRDLLLTRFLVEEQRRFLTQTVDTQSLPGSLSMGTQTDRSRSTQTDLLCLMRPEPRKAKSENDDSSDSEIDCVYKKSKGYRRCYSVIGKDKARYKIRTPIIEESESVESTRQQVNLSHRPNKSSLLRTANNRHKINTREALVEAKSKQDLKHLKSKYKSSSDLNDTKTHHVSLRDYKKSMSYVDINDPRNVLSDKEIYTPRSLKSRLIARRLSASEPPQLGAHCMSHLYQDARDRQKAIEKDPLSAEWCKTCHERKKKCTDKSKCKHQKPTSNGKGKDKQTGSSSNTSTGTKSNEQTENQHTSLPPITGMCTLKLKSKNQALMEKKSVFTIAYDGATTHHLTSSSNGSVQE